MDVMRLGEAYVVVREIVHDLRQVLVEGKEDVDSDTELRQVLVEGKEDVDSDTEVGGIEEGLSLLLAFLLNLADPIEPAGRTRYDGNMSLETFQVIAYGCSGRGKLDRHISAFESLRAEILGVVDIDDRD